MATSDPFVTISPPNAAIARGTRSGLKSTVSSGQRSPSLSRKKGMMGE
jgi:hypothetical protein